MEQDNKKIKWYHRPVSIVVAVLVIGPFALPLVWVSPSLKRWHKIAITFLLVALSAWLVKASADFYRTLLEQLKYLRELQ